METETSKTAQWVAAMEASGREHLQAEFVNPTTYTVRSASKKTCGKHIVTLDRPGGQIVNCSDCPGWEHFKAGHSRPCKHSGAVARRLLRERHIRVEVPVPAGPSSLEDSRIVETAPTNKGQLFQAAA